MLQASSMKRVHQLIFTACLLALSNSTVGCADPNDPSVAAEDDLSREKSDLKIFRDALQGIESNGGEGDPVPYQAILVTSKVGDLLDADTLATRIGAKIPGIRTRNAVYGFQSYQSGGDMAVFWAAETAINSDAEDEEEEKIRVRKMKKLRALCESKLKNLSTLVVGVRSTPADPASIENGAVADVIVGQLPSGKLVVLYGINIWT
jgi:hypothetical protein